MIDNFTFENIVEHLEEHPSFDQLQFCREELRALFLNGLPTQNYSDYLARLSHIRDSLLTDAA